MPTIFASFPRTIDEIVIADVEPVRKTEVLAKDVEWRLAVQTGEGQKAETLTFTKADFTDAELTTVMTSRFAGGDEKREIETVFASGVTLEKLAEKAGVKSFSGVKVITYEGKSVLLDMKTVREKQPVLAWIQNRQYAMDDSETGLSLVFQDGEAGDYIFSVKSLGYQIGE